MSTCHEPGNNKPLCIMSDVLDTLTEDVGALKVGHHGTISALARLDGKVVAVRSDQRVANRKLDRIIEGLRLGNVTQETAPVVRPPEVSIPDWEPDEPTLSGREPELAATLWKARAVDSNDKIAELQAALAAALARIEATEAERKRNSDRAQAIEDRRWSKWQKIGAGILALLASLGGGVGIAKLLGG